MAQSCGSPWYHSKVKALDGTGLVRIYLIGIGELVDKELVNVSVEGVADLPLLLRGQGRLIAMA